MQFLIAAARNIRTKTRIPCTTESVRLQVLLRAVGEALLVAPPPVVTGNERAPPAPAPAPARGPEGGTLRSVLAEAELSAFETAFEEEEMTLELLLQVRDTRLPSKPTRRLKDNTRQETKQGKGIGTDMHG